MHPEIQKLSDMLAAMQAQRDSALNANVFAHAEVVALKRTVAERDTAIKHIGEEMERLRAERAATAVHPVAVENLPSNPYAGETPQ